MASPLLGALLSISILAWSLWHSNAHSGSFVNIEGILIVFAGTAAVALMVIRGERLRDLAAAFARANERRARAPELRAVLLSSSEALARGKAPADTFHPFVNRVLGWVSAGIREDALERLLRERAEFELGKLEGSAQALAELSKYPPALGMIGTVLGIISIFSELGAGTGQAALGAHLAVAMTSTFYGLVLTNFVISPLAERLGASAREYAEELNLISDVARDWGRRENLVLTRERIGLHDAA
jgi:chemotaxis protein MotA